MRVLCLLGLMLPFLGCSISDELGQPPANQGEEPLGNEEADDFIPAINTTSQIYTLVQGDQRVNASIEATYHNATDSPVYLSRCGIGEPTPILDKRTDEGWTGAYGANCADVLVPAIMILPGESYTQVFEVEAWSRYNTLPSLNLLNPPGKYRMRLELYKKWPARSSDLVPLQERTSNTFELKTES